MINTPGWANLLDDWANAPVTFTTARTSNSITTATVTTRGRKYFCKAAPADQSKAVQKLRVEAVASTAHQQAAAPFHGLLEGHGWAALVFDHVEGRHPRFCPAAIGLELTDRIANLIRTPAEVPAPDLPSITDRFNNTPDWDRLQDDHPHLIRPETKDFLTDGQQSRMALLEGTHIAHTDIHQGNIIVADQDTTIIDWGWAAHATPWFDQALLGVQLIAAGASITRVVDHLRTRHIGHPCSTDELTAFAIEMSRYWISRTITSPAEQHLWHLIEAAGWLTCQLIEG